MIKALIKKVASSILSGYDIYKVYYLSEAPAKVEPLPDEMTIVELTDASLSQYESELLNSNGFYLGEESIGFACLSEGEVVGVCFFWFGKRYAQRNFIRLDKSEAKLVQVETLSSQRGKGIAPKLINFASRELLTAKGFTKLYARIWHSNTPSIKCFTKSGWCYQKTIIDIFIRFLPKLRLSWPLGK